MLTLLINLLLHHSLQKDIHNRYRIFILKLIGIILVLIHKQQSLLLFLIQSVILRHKPDALTPLLDNDVAEAAAAVAAAAVAAVAVAAVAAAGVAVAAVAAAGVGVAAAAVATATLKWLKLRSLRESSFSGATVSAPIPGSPKQTKKESATVCSLGTSRRPGPPGPPPVGAEIL